MPDTVHHHHYYGHPPPRPSGPGTNGFAVAALILGIVGLCGCIGILGIVFGVIARDQIAITGESGQGMAIAGIVLGCISIVPTIIWVVSWGGG